MSITKRLEERDFEYENAFAFSVTKPVDLVGLVEEFRKELGWNARKKFSLTAEGDPANASEESPLTVWLTIDSGDKPDINAFKRVITKHHAEAYVDQITALCEKAENEEDLTSEEIQLVLRQLLLRGSRGF